MYLQGFKIAVSTARFAPFSLSRPLSTSAFILAKKKGKTGGKHTKDAQETEFEVVDVKKFVSQATAEFEKTLELHKKKLAQKKVGSASTTIFDELKVGKEGRKYTDVATTNLKGRNALIVTVFDPKETKNVISAIMAAGLNLNPEKIPNNEQQLKVSLPPVTTETRLAVCKELKAVFEEYRHSALKESLGHIRGEIMKELKKLEKKNDDVKKVIQDVEKLHKEYTTKLQDQLKQAEKSVMNQ